MSSIRILPENLANQIAAGEVIERPASVVKELLENAIDAGASQILVQVERNITRRIRVVDDGCGMDQDDALLCLERHATSKLREAGDLAAIHTLGFRGEAVPSVAAVSRLSLLSRPRDSELGTLVEVRYGKVTKVHEMGSPVGTSMEVRDLFGNLPARRKFLKSVRTELSHVEEVVKNYAVAYPERGFSYEVEGRPVFSWPGAVDSLGERVARLFPRLGRKDLLEVELAGDLVRQCLGFLVVPERLPVSTGRLRLFVNGRLVRDRMLAHAVGEGLQGFLLKGRQPAGALFLEVDPAEVDVNVHPTKQEIRFRRGREAHRFVATAVRQALAIYQDEHRRQLFGPAPTATSGLVVSEPSPDTVQGGDRLEEPCRRQPSEPVAEFGPLDVDAGPRPLPTAAASAGLAVEQPLAETGGLRVIGQVFNGYLLCERQEQLLVIDQHAAHERLLYERLKAARAASGMAGQGLLFPRLFDCSGVEAGFIEEHGRELARLGLEVELFGGNSCRVRSVPAALADLDAGEILGSLFGQLRQERPGAQGLAALLDQVLADLACKAAVKAGDRLSIQEIEELLSMMEDAATFSHCPHGRPVVKCFSRPEVKKWFHRS